MLISQASPDRVVLTVVTKLLRGSPTTASSGAGSMGEGFATILLGLRPTVIEMPPIKLSLLRLDFQDRECVIEELVQTYLARIAEGETLDLSGFALMANPTFCKMAFTGWSSPPQCLRCRSCSFLWRCSTGSGDFAAAEVLQAPHPNANPKVASTVRLAHRSEGWTFKISGYTRQLEMAL